MKNSGAILQRLDELRREDERMEQARILDKVINKAYEAGKRSMIGLLREAFDAGQSNCCASEWDLAHELAPDEAFNQFLKENNIEI